MWRRGGAYHRLDSKMEKKVGLSSFAWTPPTFINGNGDLVGPSLTNRPDRE